MPFLFLNFESNFYIIAYYIIMNKIVLTGGGTAGHIIPNLSLIPHLSPYFDEIHYIGSANSLEQKLATNEHLSFFPISTAKLKREFSLDNFKMPLKVIKGIYQAKSILKKLKPNVIFSKGGYVSLPVVFAGKSLGIPIITHESDLSLGLANKLISRKAEKVLTSFPETAKTLKNGQCVGAPIKTFSLVNKEKALKYYGFSGKKPVLLILGGSQGSKAINNALLSSANDLLPRFDILHICGKGNLPTYNSEGRLSIEYEENMSQAFAVADVVISRAGATTLFELLSLKIPSVVVPLKKGASRGDQIQNAEYFYKKGLVNMIYEENLTDASLNLAVFSTYADRFNFKRRLSNQNVTNGCKKIAEILSSYA